MGDKEMSDADKRLARLGGPTTTTTPAAPDNQAGPSSTPGTASPAPTAPAASMSTSILRAGSGASRLLSTAQAAPSPSSTPPPAKASGVKRPSDADARAAPVLARSTRIPAPAPEPSTTALVKTEPARQTPTVAYDVWEEEAIATILSVTLDARASDFKLCWLKGLAREMVEEGRPLKTSFENRDELLVARLSLDQSSLGTTNDPDLLEVLAGLPQDESVFEYLAGCWKRLYQASRALRSLAYSEQEKAQWAKAFNGLKELVVSYCGMSLEDPTMFPQATARPTGPAEFLPLLLAVASTAPSVNTDPFTSSAAPVVAPPRGPLSPAELAPFLNDLAACNDAERLQAVLTPTLSLFFQEWFKITPTPDLLGDDWRRYLGAVGLLVQVKGIAAILPSLPIWVAPNVTAPKLEWQSLLGPLSRLSVFPHEFPQITQTYFSNPTDRKVADIDANKSNLRQTLGALQTSLFNIYNAIVRGSPEAREGVLSFLALVAKLNIKRQGMRVDRHAVSSDGYMTNLQVVLLKLFEPVMDIQFSKIDKVDADYYRISDRIDVTDETKIRGTKEEADEYFGGAIQPDAKPNFISDLFFLLNAFQHLGLIKTIANRKKMERAIGDIEKELKHVEAERHTWAGNAATTAQGEALIKKHKASLASYHASIHAYDTQLLDPALTRLNVTFCGFLMTWLLRLVDPASKHPTTPVALPLPEEAPLSFRMLPEYLFDNVTEYYDFLTRYDPDALDNADKDVIITFAIVFLSPGYVNNPFLKAKLVGILSNGLYPAGYHRKGPLFDRLSLHPMSTEHLMPTLIRFFIDVEMTGGHTQFWDKFNFRRDISHIFKAMWENPLHREAFVRSRHDDFDQFIKFVNMLMSDTTFHLEESLTNLAKISSLQAQQADAAGWAALEQAERDDLTSQLRQAEGSAPFHTSMGLDHIELIRDLTATTKEPFLTGEIVDRLAASLDENLVNLVGPKMQELKVADPKRFAFKPKALLAAIASIYLNLGESTEFIRAVANDGRSYSRELFERFARVLEHRAIITADEVRQVVAFTQKVEDMKATIEVEDEREIPDEFLDPLLYTLMKDPVILPVSRVSIDRSTIRAHLLSQSKDPFSGVELKYDECVPDTELKAKIDAWIAEGSAAGPQAVMDVDK